jgi:hypothetical protein
MIAVVRPSSGNAGEGGVRGGWVRDSAVGPACQQFDPLKLYTIAMQGFESGQIYAPVLMWMLRSFLLQCSMQPSRFCAGAKISRAVGKISTTSSLHRKNGARRKFTSIYVVVDDNVSALYIQTTA